jgi:translocator protein
MTVASQTAGRGGSSRGPSAAVLVGFLVLCVGGGALIGVLFAGQAAEYQGFDLPPWAPPSWLFGPVWTVLYTLMGVSAWVVWRTHHPFRGRALGAFVTQLVLNFAWTPVFFGAEQRALGFVVIIAVLLAAGWWAFEAARVNRWAGALQLPYLVWVSFASVLNGAIAFT